jgi:hypothetical protein
MARRSGFLVALALAALVVTACEKDDGGAGAPDAADDTGGTGHDVDDGDTGDGQAVALTPANLLFVEQSVRTSTSYVDLRFAAPPALGATRYALEVSDDDRATWHAFQYQGVDLTTDAFADVTQANNFSIDIEQDRWLRLRITGGAHDGATSNEAWVVRCSTDSYVSSWTLDESVANTGVMAPHVGYGLAASFTLNRYSDGGAIADAPAVQWYRVDPADYGTMTPIDGATSLAYTTVEADRGFRLLVRAEGAGAAFDGFCQALSTWIVEP